MWITSYVCVAREVEMRREDAVRRREREEGIGSGEGRWEGCEGNNE